MPHDNSGGKHAGGQLLTSLGVFLGVALVPTVLASWLLRGNARVWQAIAVTSLAFVAVGVELLQESACCSTGSGPLLARRAFVVTNSHHWRPRGQGSPRTCRQAAACPADHDLEA